MENTTVATTAMGYSLTGPTTNGTNDDEYNFISATTTAEPPITLKMWGLLFIFVVIAVITGLCILCMILLVLFGCVNSFLCIRCRRCRDETSEQA